MKQELITIKQAADILSVHPLTVYRMVRSGKLPGFKTAGKREITVPKKAVEDLSEPRPINAGKPS